MATAYIEVSPQDILERRAQLHMSPEAKIKLCHKAGAPWNDDHPDAELHDLQKECLRRGERHKIIHGGSRLGKSVLGGCEGIIEQMHLGANTAIVASRYAHVSHEFQYVHRGMRQLFKDTPQAFRRMVYRHSANYHDYECHTIWDSMTRGYSVAEDEGAALLGQAFTRVILGEGSHVSHDILQKKVFRALDGAAAMAKSAGVQSGWLSIYTTPTGYEGCSAAEFERIKQAGVKGALDTFHYGKVPFSESWWVREAAVTENPVYDLDVFEARKKTLSKAAFEEQYLGLMTFASGRIYAEFNQDTHVVTALPTPDQIRQMRLGVGIDTGAYFGAVLAGIDRDERLWLLGETYTQKQTIDKACDELHDMIVSTLGPAFQTESFAAIADQIDLWTVDPASQHKLEIIDRLDVTLSTPARNEGRFELLPTIDQVRSLFGEDRLFVHDSLSWTIDQLRKYVWKVRSRVTPQVKEPKKEYDHLVDALRFIVVPLMQLGPELEPPTPRTFQEAWEHARKERVVGPLRQILAQAKNNPRHQH